MFSSLQRPHHLRGMRGSKNTTSRGEQPRLEVLNAGVLHSLWTNPRLATACSSRPANAFKQKRTAFSERGPMRGLREVLLAHEEQSHFKTAAQLPVGEIATATGLDFEAWRSASSATTISLSSRQCSSRTVCGAVANRLGYIGNLAPDALPEWNIDGTIPPVSSRLVYTTCFMKLTAESFYSASRRWSTIDSSMFWRRGFPVETANSVTLYRTLGNGGCDFSRGQMAQSPHHSPHGGPRTMFV